MRRTGLLLDTVVARLVGTARRVFSLVVVRLGALGGGRAGLLLVLAASVMLANAASGREASAQVDPAGRPNIVFVLTDDNDARTYEDFMPRTKRLIGDAGVTFENATYGHSLCCPSRASIQRGQYPHNTGVFQNAPPNGGFGTFRELGRTEDTYATDLKAAGYRTGYFGKYMNGYEDFLSFQPPGWDYWLAGAPMSTKYSLNGRIESSLDGPIERAVGVGTYREARFDELVADEGIRWIRDASAGSDPFMATLSFHAPHTPAEHPRRFDAMYQDEPLPKPPSYDERDLSDKPRWLQAAQPISPEDESSMTEYYRNRLRSVEYVDRQVARLVGALEGAGELGNTYVVFYSDNGYHLGHHRLPSQHQGGKATPYVEDVRFPIVVRGPGIDPGRTSEAMVQNVDLRPTFAAMAGSQAPDYVDGVSLLPEAQGTGTFPRQYAYSERLQSDGGPTVEEDDWKAVYTPDAAYHYWFRTGEEELYDLAADPHELQNVLAGGASEAEAVPFREAMIRMQDCRGAECGR
jgi:N-acetylglucosamine-6-sulfatase